MDYKYKKEIGQGAYGTIYKSINNKTFTTVAIKTLTYSRDQGVTGIILNEISAYNVLNNHENILKMIEVFSREINDTVEVNIVLEYMNFDLDTYIEKFNISNAQIQEFSRQLLVGLEYIHVNNYIHRDIKPSNLLVSKDLTLKIADFGLAINYHEKMKLSPIVVTLWYRSPEILQCKSYNSSVDIWSAGCIIAELFEKKVLFMGMAESEQLNLILRLFINNELSISKLIKELPRMYTSNNHIAIDLLKKMLAFSPSDRLTANDCLEHAYFKTLYIENH